MKNQLLAIPGWYARWMHHFNMDPAGFALRFSDNNEWPIREIAEQIHCYPRAIAKLGPLHLPGMIYRREALEQSSGMSIAVWRAKTWISYIQHKRENPEDTPYIQKNSNSSVNNDDKPLIADLTGGLGVDTAAFALEGTNVHYCERNPDILEIARHNHTFLGCSTNIQYHNDDSFHWLGSLKSKEDSAAKKKPKPPKSSKLFNLVFIDPSRRKNGRRVISLEKSEPVITDHIELIRSVAERYLIKLSPVLDLTEIERKLPDCKRIIAVSVHGEVKELLADCIPSCGEKRSKATPGESPEMRDLHRISSHQESVRSGKIPNNIDPDLPGYDLLHQKPEKHAVILDQTGGLSFHIYSKKNGYGTNCGIASFENDDMHGNQEFSISETPSNFIFEPDPAIIKMGLVDELSREFGLRRVNRNTPYLYGDLAGRAGDPAGRAGDVAGCAGDPAGRCGDPAELSGGGIHASFPGKCYRIIQEFPYKPRLIKKWLAQNECTRVQIHKRGFPLSVEQLYRNLGCAMGGDVHLIATKNGQGNLVLFIAESL